MILVLGHFPSPLNEQDGMVQRILAIDNLLSSFERTYITTDNVFSTAKKFRHPLRWIRCKLNSRKLVIDDKITVVCKIDDQNLGALMAEAQVIYVHSLYFLRNIPSHLLQQHGAKTFLDIHGCVVEENIQMQASSENISALRCSEENAFQYVGHLIAVSEKMVDFYKTKYSPRGSFYVLPIFNEQKSFPVGKSDASHAITIVYSGGAQVWQNVERMISTISATFHKYTYLILTPQVKVFESMLDADVRKNTTVISVPKNDITKYYAEATFGFVLRDNNVVNTVSCPTKIIEYIQNGIIPVVLQPEIGDFNTMGYRYILNEALVQGELPSQKEIEEMRKKNETVMQEMSRKRMEGQADLLAAIKSLVGCEE